tara:strand:- start:4810 stop:5214 length:405 start_codon:yes stop_codon:yes gene_type:complete
MAFNPKQIYPDDLNPSKAIGIDLPLNGNAVFKPNFQTKDAIKSSLLNFFLTNPGERYLNPLFGAGLRSFIFEQIEDNNISSLTSTVNSLLQQYFNNINVESLDILKQEDNNTIIIVLKYSIINTNINDTINIQY